MPKSSNTGSAALADVEKPIDVEELFDLDDEPNQKQKSLADQGGVDESISDNNLEWAMAMSGDEPSLREALFQLQMKPFSLKLKT